METNKLLETDFSENSQTNHQWIQDLLSSTPITIDSKSTGSDAPGLPGNLTLIAAADDQRKGINNDLSATASIKGYLATGAITGGIIGAAEYTLDKRLVATAGQPQTGIMGWWQTNSPILKEQASYAQRVAGTGELHTARIVEGGSLAGRALGGAAKGLAIAGGSLAAGYALDTGMSKMFGYKAPETDGLGRIALDGIAVPTILMSDLPGRYKFALAGTAFITARAAECFEGTTGASVQMSPLMSPKLSDGVGITAAAMAPLDLKWKAAAIGGIWLLNRAYNGIAGVAGLDGGQPMELKLNQDNSLRYKQFLHSASRI